MNNNLRRKFFKYASETGTRLDLFTDLENFFIQDFEDEFAKSNNRKEFLEEEIKKIKGIIVSAEINKEDLLRLSYSSNYYNSTIIPPSRKRFNKHQLILIGYGKALASYHKHLDQVYRQIVKEGDGREQLTILEQLIMIHYLGILNKLKGCSNDTSLAKFLSRLTSKSEQEIRRHLGDYLKFLAIINGKEAYSPGKTKKAKSFERDRTRVILKRMKNEFEKINLASVSKIIQRDINRIKKEGVIKL